MEEDFDFNGDMFDEFNENMDYNGVFIGTYKKHYSCSAAFNCSIYGNLLSINIFDLESNEIRITSKEIEEIVTFFKLKNYDVDVEEFDGVQCLFIDELSSVHIN